MSSRLSSLLVQDGVVSAAKMADALQRQVIQGGALDSNLLETKAIDEDALVAYLGRAASLPTQPTGIAAAGLPLPEVIEIFSLEVAKRFRAIPTTLRPGGVLRVLVTSEVEIADIDNLALTVRQRIEPWVVLEFRFFEALEKVYGSAAPVRFTRLLQRSQKAHEGRSYPASRLIDPIPRFGSLSEVRLSGPPAADAPAPAAAPTVDAAPAPTVVPAQATTVAAPVAAEATIPIVVPVVPEVSVSMVVPVAPAPPAEPAVVAAPVAAPVVTPAAVSAVAPVAASAAPPVVETPPVVVVSAAPPVVSEAVPTPVPGPETPAAAPSASATSYSGLDKLSMDEWESVSAADWLSVANKIEPTDAASSRSPAAPPQPVAIAPAAKVEPVAASKPTPAPVTAAPTAAAAKPAAQPASAPSAVSPSEAGRRGKKRKGQQGAPVAQAQGKPAAAAPATTAPVPAPAASAPVAKPAPVAQAKAAVVSTPVAQTKAPVAQPAATSKPAAVAKPAAAASAPAKPSVTASAIPAVKPVASSPADGAPSKAAAPPAVAATAAKPAPAQAAAPVAAQATKERSQPTIVSPAGAKPAAAVKPATVPAVAAVTPATPAPAAAVVPAAVDASAQKAARPESTGAVPEAIPEPINSGRLGELLLSAPPPSAESPESEEVPGPAPRVAVALDESSGAPLSLEAARELVAVATERDAIFEALCRGARSRARFACVFTLHGEVAFGRVALEDGWLERQQVGRVSVPLDRASTFRSVAKGRQPHIGALGDPAVTNDPLRALGRRPPVPCALLAILLRGRPVALLYLDDDGRALSEALPGELQPLLSEVGQAFQRLVQQAKSGGLGGMDDFDAIAAPGEVTDPGTSAWRPRSQKTPAPAVAAAPSAAPAPAAVAAPAVVAAPAPAAPVVEAPAPVPVPVAASEQPTRPLRVDRGQKPVQPEAVAKAPEKAPEKPIVAATAVDKTEKTEKVEKTERFEKIDRADAGPKTTGKQGKAGKGSSKSPAGASVSPASKDSPKDAGKELAKEGATESWAALIERAAGQDTAAAQALLAGGDAAVRALVAALPGPLRSQDKPAVGDPQDAEAALSHSPLLGILLRMGSRSVPALIERLADKETPARARFFIVECLGEMPVLAALDALYERLFDSDEEVRGAAAAALRNFPPSPAVSGVRGKLRDLLSDGSGDAKRLGHAVDALGELRDTTAVPQIIDLLDAGDALLVDAAGQALQSITKQDFGRSRFRWSGWWRRHQSEPRLQWLLSGLCHGSAMIRSAAQDELSGMSGDVAGYRFDQPARERDAAAKQWADWWLRHGYDVV